MNTKQIVATALSIVLILLGSVHATASDPCQLPAGWQPMTTTTEGAIRAAVAPATTPIIVAKPFAIEFAVCSNDHSIEQITVDAVMPAHNHGMNYRPEVSNNGNRRYSAKPMLFHMPGVWRINVVAHLEGKAHHMSLDMELR